MNYTTRALTVKYNINYGTATNGGAQGTVGYDNTRGFSNNDKTTSTSAVHM